MYVVFAGSEHFLVPAGSYSMRVELIVGTRTRLDYVELEWLGYGSVEEYEPVTTWSRIKTLFR